MIPKGFISIRIATVYWLIAVFFLIAVSSGAGRYLTQFSLEYPALLLCMLIWVYLLNRGRVIRYFLNSWECLGGLMLFLFLTLMTLPDPMAGTMPQATGIIVYVLGFTLAALLARKHESFNSAVLVALLFSAVVNLYEYFLSPNMFSIAPGRAAGFHVNPNVSGMLLAAMWALWMATRSGRQKILSAAISAVVLIGVFVTFSRSAIIEFIAIGLLSLWISDPERKHPMLYRVGWLSLMSVIVIYVTAVFLSADISDDARLRLSSLLEGDFSDASTTGRTDALLRYWDLFLDSPLIGAGRVISVSELGTGGPHNAFVGMAADYGVFPVLILVAVVGHLCFVAYKNRFLEVNDRVQVMAAFCLFFGGIFSHNFFYDLDAKLLLGIMLGFNVSRGESSDPSRLVRLGSNAHRSIYRSIDR